MATSFRLIPAFILMAALTSIAFSTGNPVKSYIKSIKKHRKKIHKEFKNPESSPLREGAKDFKGLDYYDADPAYHVKAYYRRVDDPQPFEMPTSNPDRNKVYLKYAVLEFELKGEFYQLAVYYSPSLAEKYPEYKDHLFLPFNDLTNYEETYGGGRYLDLTIPEQDSLDLDFNLCYNPYCAYTDGWSCPIPPEENKLDVAIKAGVKQYEEH